MADNTDFLPEDSDPLLATPQQWASMTFAPMVIDANKFGPDWDQTRGAVARAAVALLGFDDQELTRHFLAHPDPLRRAMDVHAGLQQEIEYLKTHIQALDTLATRVLCAASRCIEPRS